MFTQIKNFLLWPYRKIRAHYALKRKLKSLRDHDPFIYK